MRQVLWEIPAFGGIKIFGYGMMLFVAFLGSMHLAAWRARREKLDPEVVYDLGFWVFAGGLLGARAFYVWQYWGTRIKGLYDVIAIWEGGIVLYGSIMGGTAAFFLYRLLRPFPLRPMLDAVAPALALGIAIGRFGCFLNGCCYGDPCPLPWAVSFPPGSPPWWDQATARQLPGVTPEVLERVKVGQVPAGTPWSRPVHPTQLYSVLDGLILVGLLSAYYPLRRRDGEVMALMMVTYPVTRFLIERLRNDEKIFAAGLTISQSVSVFVFACGVLFWLWLLRQPAVRHADVAESPAPALPARATA